MPKKRFMAEEIIQYLRTVEIEQAKGTHPRRMATAYRSTGRCVISFSRGSCSIL